MRVNVIFSNTFHSLCTKEFDRKVVRLERSSFKVSGGLFKFLFSFFDVKVKFGVVYDVKISLGEPFSIYWHVMSWLSLLKIH